MSVKQDLKNIYNTFAKKYYESRKKVWYDVKRILEELENYKPKWTKKNSEKIKILELGCGGGRFCDYVSEKFDNKIDYIGVDLSQNLLDLAQKDYPKKKFVCDDMVNFVQNEEQEKYDFIVITAAFQHIPSYKERVLLMKHFYRILKYEGKLVMLNWAFSDWFKNRYSEAVRKAFWKYVFSFGKNKWNDILVPRKTKNGVVHRYYHLFDIDELTQLAKIGGFVVKISIYLDKRGQTVESNHMANNSLLVASKMAIL